MIPLSIHFCILLITDYLLWLWLIPLSVTNWRPDSCFWVYLILSDKTSSSQHYASRNLFNVWIFNLFWQLVILRCPECQFKSGQQEEKAENVKTNRPQHLTFPTCELLHSLLLHALSWFSSFQVRTDMHLDFHEETVEIRLGRYQHWKNSQISTH